MTRTEGILSDFGDRLRGYVAKHVRDENDAEDVLQEIFIKIHAGLNAVKDPSKLEAWLFQVARRALLDYFRGRTGRRHAVALPAELTEQPSSLSVSAEVASWLEPLMTLLPEEDREALRSSDRDGLPQRELTTRLGLSLSGAKSRVQRARHRLKKVLLQCCTVETDRRGNPIGYACKGGPCTSCACGSERNRAPGRVCARPEWGSARRLR